MVVLFFIPLFSKGTFNYTQSKKISTSESSENFYLLSELPEILPSSIIMPVKAFFEFEA